MCKSVCLWFGCVCMCAKGEVCVRCLPVHCAGSVFKIAAQTTLMKTSTVKTTQQMRQQQRSVGLQKAFYSCSSLWLCVSERARSLHREKIIRPLF